VFTFPVELVLWLMLLLSWDGKREADERDLAEKKKTSRVPLDVARARFPAIFPTGRNRNRLLMVFYSGDLGIPK